MRASNYPMRCLEDNWTPSTLDVEAYDVPLFGEDTGDNDWYYSWLVVTLRGYIYVSSWRDYPNKSVHSKLSFTPFNDLLLHSEIIEYTSPLFKKKKMNILARIKMWWKS